MPPSLNIYAGVPSGLKDGSQAYKRTMLVILLFVCWQPAAVLLDDTVVFFKMSLDYV